MNRNTLFSWLFNLFFPALGFQRCSCALLVCQTITTLFSRSVNNVLPLPIAAYQSMPKRRQFCQMRPFSRCLCPLLTFIVDLFTCTPTNFPKIAAGTFIHNSSKPRCDYRTQFKLCWCSHRGMNQAGAYFISARIPWWTAAAFWSIKQPD